MIADWTPWTVVSRSRLMSSIITVMLDPAKLHTNWASASGTRTPRATMRHPLSVGRDHVRLRGSRSGCLIRAV
ncbi:hypothetical protein GCM10022243_30830 [Saccharothrix violaceirubra]